MESRSKMCKGRNFVTKEDHRDYGHRGIKEGESGQ